MGRFLIKIIIFSLPIALLFAFPIAVFLLGREEYSMQTAARMQAAHSEIMVGKAYTDTDNTGIFYKTALLQDKQPEIIAIGSSRTMEFRKEFFAKPDTFLNTAFGAADPDRAEQFVRDLPSDNGVRVILLGLDHRTFKPDYVPVVPNGSATISRLLTDFISYDWRWIYYDYARGRFTFKQLLARNRNSNDIGLAALIEGNGFRGDGSYSFKVQLEDPYHAEELTNMINAKIAALKRDRNSFEYGPDISRTALESLNRTLALAQQRHIIVIGFLSPYAPALYQEMLSVHDTYRRSVFALPAAIRAVFSKHGFSVYDFTDATVLGDTNGEYFDPEHPTDKLNLRMLVYMAQREPALRSYVDISKARSLIEKTSGTFFPFPAL